MSNIRNVKQVLKEGIAEWKADFRTEILEPFEDLKQSILFCINGGTDVLANAIHKEIVLGEKVNWQILEEKYPAILHFKKRFEESLA